MKNIIFSIGLILILGLSALAQKHKQDPESQPIPKDPNTASSRSIRSNSSAGAMLDAGTRIDGQLQSTLDVKKTQVGDQIQLKTTKDIKQNGRTVVAKGTTLIGRVTEVAQRTKSNGTSRLGMVFERLEGRNLELPISASIVSITQAAGHANVADMADADIFGSSSTSASSSGSNRPGSGGLLGGVGNTVGNTVGGTAGGVTNTAGSVLNTTTQTVGGVTNSTGRTVGNTTGTLGRTADGLQISNSASANASANSATTLSSANRNIRIEKGANIGLQLNSSARSQ